MNAKFHFGYERTLDVCRKFDVVAVEDLNICSLVKNHHLAKSISDAALTLARESHP